MCPALASNPTVRLAAVQPSINKECACRSLRVAILKPSYVSHTLEITHHCSDD